MEDMEEYMKCLDIIADCNHVETIEYDEEETENPNCEEGERIED